MLQAKQDLLGALAAGLEQLSPGAGAKATFYMPTRRAGFTPSRGRRKIGPTANATAPAPPGLDAQFIGSTAVFGGLA